MDGVRIPISSATDIVTARLQGRAWAEKAGLEGSDLAAISAVISETARKIANSVGGGKLAISIPQEGGIVVIARAFIVEKSLEAQIARRFSEFMDELKVYSVRDGTFLKMTKRRAE